MLVTAADGGVAGVFSWEWLGQLGGYAGVGALTVVLFWALTVGRLYTRGQHDSIVSLYQKAAEKDAQTIEQQAAQIKSLLEGNATAADFFAKVPVKDESGETVPHPARRKASPKQGAPK